MTSYFTNFCKWQKWLTKSQIYRLKPTNFKTIQTKVAIILDFILLANNTPASDGRVCTSNNNCKSRRANLKTAVIKMSTERHRYCHTYHLPLGRMCMCGFSGKVIKFQLQHRDSRHQLTNVARRTYHPEVRHIRRCRAPSLNPRHF